MPKSKKRRSPRRSPRRRKTKSGGGDDDCYRMSGIYRENCLMAKCRGLPDEKRAKCYLDALKAAGGGRKKRRGSP